MTVRSAPFVARFFRLHVGIWGRSGAYRSIEVMT